MDSENKFNYSSQNTFKKSKSSNSSGIGKTVFVPFVSGVVGASIVMATCFGVPTIKSKIMGNNNFTSPTSTASINTNYSPDLINLTEYSDTAVSVASKVLPSVVGITVSYNISSFFGNTTGEATGSGIIISEDGYILTNNHVISNESSSSYYAIEEATGITVKLYNDSETYSATVIGTDSYTDLAVIKIDKNGLTKAELGDSNQVKVGEFAMAIGNPVGMDYSVTCGVISAINREVKSDGTTYEAIQTDAAINSGNSGGALVNSKGQVIGINTLKLAGTGIEGIGFAIPISSTTNIVNQLIEYKTVKRPYIGISGSDISSTISKRYNIPQGVYVEKVEKDSPAEKAGLQEKDIITKIEGTEITSINELNKVKYKYNIGDKIKLTIFRNNEEKEIEITLAETPTEEKQENNSQSAPNSNNNNNSQDFFGNSIFDLFR